MKVDEALAGNLGAGDDINGSNASGAIGAMVVNEDSVVDCHRPM